MNRRQVLITGLVGMGACAVGPITSKAQVESQSDILVTSEIGNNHGHELLLNPADVIALLRSSKDGGPQTLNIQGQSRHPHQLTLEHQDVLSLLLDGQIERPSSEDLGHSHVVIIRMDLTNA